MAASFGGLPLPVFGGRHFRGFHHLLRAVGRGRAGVLHFSKGRKQAGAIGLVAAFAILRARRFAKAKFHRVPARKGERERREREEREREE